MQCYELSSSLHNVNKTVTVPLYPHFAPWRFSATEDCWVPVCCGVLRPGAFVLPPSLISAIFVLCFLWTVPRDWWVCIAFNSSTPAFPRWSPLVWPPSFSLLQLRPAPSTWPLIGAAISTPEISLQQSVRGRR